MPTKNLRCIATKTSLLRSSSSILLCSSSHKAPQPFDRDSAGYQCIPSKIRTPPPLVLTLITAFPNITILPVGLHCTVGILHKAISFHKCTFSGNQICVCILVRLYVHVAGGVLGYAQQVTKCCNCSGFIEVMDASNKLMYTIEGELLPQTRQHPRKASCNAAFGVSTMCSMHIRVGAVTLGTQSDLHEQLVLSAAWPRLLKSLKLLHTAACVR